MSISHDINHPVLTQNQNVLQYSLLNFQRTREKHEIINRSRVNLGFTRTTKELFQLTNSYMTLSMDFKPLTFTLYFIFPKFVPRNQLQIGRKKDDIDCRKEGKTNYIAIYI